MLRIATTSALRPDCDVIQTRRALCNDGLGMMDEFRAVDPIGGETSVDELQPDRITCKKRAAHTCEYDTIKISALHGLYQRLESSRVESGHGKSSQDSAWLENILHIGV